MTTENRIRRFEIMISEERFETSREKLGNYIFKNVIRKTASESTKKLLYKVLKSIFLNHDFVDGVFLVILDLLHKKAKSDFEFFFTTLKDESRNLKRFLDDSTYLEQVNVLDEINNIKSYETKGLKKIQKLATKIMIKKYHDIRRGEINHERFYRIES